jgi:hypothetical protein
VIELHISYTLRSPHPSSEWTMVHEENKRFPDMAAAMGFLKQQYGHVKKRRPCYVDTKSRGTIQCGWIYCYKGERDISHGDMRTIYQQDWVHVYHADYRSVDVTQKEVSHES